MKRLPLATLAFASFLLPAELQASLIIYHEFEEENSGVFTDTAGNYDGTAEGDAATLDTVTAKIGSGSLLLGGSEDRVDLGITDDDLVGISEFTVTAWINPTSISGDNYIFGNTFTNQASVIFRHDGGELEIGLFTGGSWSGNPNNVGRSSGAGITTNSWTHVALVWDGEVATLYAGGSVVGTFNYNDGTLDRQNGMPPAAIGTFNGDNSTGAFEGNIDDLAVWDEVLTADQIAGLANETLTVLGIASGELPNLAFSVRNATNGTDLDFNWSSQAGKVYDLLSSTDPETDGDPGTWTVITGQEGIAATPPTNTRTVTRPGDTTRFYVIQERDAPPPPPAFFDDFESVPNPDWTTGTNGGDAGTTAWERGAPINVGPTSGYDGSTTCFGTNISADYTLNTDIWLRTPPIDLTGGGITGATLSFWQHRDTDFDGQADDDYGTIRVLDANSLAQLGDSIATGIEGFDFDGDQNPVWVEFEAMALPAEAIGKEVVIEFRFKSDDLAATFAGWYIDDVKVSTE